ncbi:unnamed protein product [Rotaria socialis]|uniref:Uncharacterized protein n=1 Tax=Rotaria socialis TaxID=392032 RepID=A0A817ZNU1_9BILA|nr:unnamed protein product [Rotaria socialis]CAF3333399.1 unnamed protein product [Rotaria socialis]CAF3397135.1 unnamed protein product [Rotaria socialis]CAF3440210.1 unnamed protein product [Rotaria socialis]CAF3462581.1 unnamed protein product [Rotaria socialis]
MALLILCCRGSSPSTRIYMSALIALVLVCSFSCCSSSSEFLFGSPTGDTGKNVDDVDIDKKFHGQNNDDYPLPYRSAPSSIHYVNAIKNPMLSKSHLLNLLLDSALIREDVPHRQYQDRLFNRRYAPQSFHAMRG